MNQFIKHGQQHSYNWKVRGTSVLAVVFLMLLLCLGLLRITWQFKKIIPQKDELILWHDENLESAVRDALQGKIKAITVNDVSQIHNLDISDRGITDIRDLSLFKNLYSLDLSHNKISDLSPLFTLHLKVLDASYNNITSLEGISGTKGLYGLQLTGNPLTKESVDELGKMRDLTSLGVSLPLSGSWSEDSLEACCHLYRLELTGPVKDYGFLSKMPGLHYLAFYDGAMESIQPVADATEGMELIQLTIAGCGLRELTGIRKMESVTALNLQGNEIDDAGLLENMANIRYLNLSDNNLTDISGLLKAMDRDRKLVLSGNPAYTGLDDGTETDDWEFHTRFSDWKNDAAGVRIYESEHPSTLQNRLKLTLWAPLPDKVKEFLSTVPYIAAVLMLPILGWMRASAMAKMEKNESIPQLLGKYPVQDVRKYIRYDAEVYLRRFVRLERRKYTFNFSAAFCGPIWFAYRRMWKEALIEWAVMACMLYMAVCIMTGGHMMIRTSDILGWSWSLVMVLLALLNGRMADRVYWAHINRNLSIENSAACQKEKGLKCWKQDEEEGISYANGVIMAGNLLIVWKIICLWSQF